MLSSNILFPTEHETDKLHNMEKGYKTEYDIPKTTQTDHDTKSLAAQDAIS